jgi:hypothetical protein
MPLTAQEKELVATVGCPAEIGELVRTVLDHPLERFISSVEGDETAVIVTGLSVTLGERDEASKLVGQLNEKLAGHAYRAFWTRRDKGRRQQDEIVVFQPLLPFDLLLFLHTQAPNYDLDTKAIIARLTGWAEHFEIDLVGAGSDFVDLAFRTLPEDVEAFAREVYEFCPDTVDQGTGIAAEMLIEHGSVDEDTDIEELGLEMLVRSIQTEKSLFLWWD